MELLQMEKVSRLVVWLMVVLAFLGAQLLASSREVKYRIVKIDKSNHRAFVVVPATIIERQNELCSTLRSILAEIRGGKYVETAWTISLFDRQEYATYKDEVPPQSIEQWRRSYIGELEESGVFWTYPAIPEQKKKHDLSKCLKDNVTSSAPRRRNEA
jgi:hypothetical protein